MIHDEFSYLSIPYVMITSIIFYFHRRLNFKQHMNSSGVPFYKGFLQILDVTDVYNAEDLEKSFVRDANITSLYRILLDTTSLTKVGQPRPRQERPPPCWPIH